MDSSSPAGAVNRKDLAANSANAAVCLRDLNSSSTRMLSPYFLRNVIDDFDAEPSMSETSSVHRPDALADSGGVLTLLDGNL
jgi:hypothetical protein